MKHLKFILVISLITSCVQEKHKKTIHFSLDMTQVEDVRNVGVRGTNPLSWNETLPLTDKDQDGIYETSIEIFSADNGIEFKFVNQNDQFELPNQNNRVISFKYKPEDIIYEAIFNVLHNQDSF